MSKITEAFQGSIFNGDALNLNPIPRSRYDCGRANSHAKLNDYEIQKKAS